MGGPKSKSSLRKIFNLLERRISAGLSSEIRVVIEYDRKKNNTTGWHGVPNVFFF